MEPLDVYKLTDKDSGDEEIFFLLSELQPALTSCTILPKQK